MSPEPVTGGTAIELRFPLGRYHATPMGTSANDGLVEWPPSTWRLLRALYSVWRTRCAHLDEVEVLPLLDRLASPPVYHVPTKTAAGHTRHYMPGEKAGEPTTALVLDAFVTCRHDDPLIVEWQGLHLDDAERSVLEQLCAQLTWLGRAESVCDARLLESTPSGSPNCVPLDTSELDTRSERPDDVIRLLVPSRPLDEEALTVRTEALRTSAKTRTTQPRATEYLTYSRPRPEAPLHLPGVLQQARRRAPRPTAVRFSLEPEEIDRTTPRIKMSDLLLYTGTLRAAAQSRFGDLTDNSASATLSGHAGPTTAEGHRHAHYLALPAGGSEHGPHIGSFLVWAPEGFTDEEVTALRNIRLLDRLPHISEFRRLAVRATGVGSPDEFLPSWWNGGASTSLHWTTVTPVVPGRHHRGERDWHAQIQHELANAIAERGLPPADLDLRPWSGRFRTHRPGRRKGVQAHPHPHRCVLTFNEPVPTATPLTLGALSHFGLGLFRPVPEIGDAGADQKRSTVR